MRVARLVLSVFISLFLSIPLEAQQTAPSSPQALAFLQRSLAALGGSQLFTDVTLTGTARRIAGSDDETGTAVLKAISSGAIDANGVYSFTQPTVFTCMVLNGAFRCVSEIYPWDVPAGTTAVGTAHTHPDPSPEAGADVFCCLDIIRGYPDFP